MNKFLPWQNLSVDRYYQRRSKLNFRIPWSVVQCIYINDFCRHYFTQWPAHARRYFNPWWYVLQRKYILLNNQTLKPLYHMSIWDKILELCIESHFQLSTHNLFVDVTMIISLFEQRDFMCLSIAENPATVLEDISGAVHPVFYALVDELLVLLWYVSG